MKQKEINEGNVLIADFMEYVDKYSNVAKYSISWMSELKYHSSWCWLMAVVEKIESLRYDTNITNKQIVISNLFGSAMNGNIPKFRYCSDMEETKLIATYKGVIEFIKWYNENKQQDNANN